MAKYTPHTQSDVKEMLSALGLKSSQQLFEDVPQSIRYPDCGMKDGSSEADAEMRLNALANKNRVYDTVFMGAGAYKHYIPAAVRNLSARNEFVTAYTPYQAEMSQGILQSIYEYQSLICRLTGMDVSNASHYDGATAAAEACLMFADGKRNKVLVSSLIKPDVKRVMSTYFEGRGIKLVTLESFAASINMERLNAELNDEVLAVYVEQPNFYGTIEDMNTISHLVHSVGAKLIAGVYPISLGLLKKRPNTTRTRL